MREFLSYLIGPGEPPYEGLQGGGAPGELLPRHLGKNGELDSESSSGELVHFVCLILTFANLFGLYRQ